jgi:hypothetical protein
MTPEQLKQALALLILVSEPLSKKSTTQADDIGVELMKALADSPAMLQFISKHALGNPAAVAALMSRLTS